MKYDIKNQYFMKNTIKNKINQFLPSIILDIYTYLKHGIIGEYGTLSYSQEGEDIILKRMFEDQKTGFYVDVGAHHPKRFSNTYIFYLKGWSGINIEPNPDAITLFNKYRPDDINLEMGVSDKEGTIEYLMFNDPALNTFDVILSEERDNNEKYFIEKRRQVKVFRLDTIFNRYLPKGIQIDFMNIDVEGYDYQVIKSNNWYIYRPKYILIEELNIKLCDIYESDIYRYLKDINYKLFAKTLNTYFYIDSICG